MSRLGSQWLAGIGYVAAYVLLDALSFVQPLLKLGITPWNPQAGLTLAFLLLRGWRCAPWTAVAALAAELLVRDSSAPAYALLLASSVPALAYGALAWWLGESGSPLSILSRRGALAVSIGAAVAAFASALGYSTAFVVAGVLPLDVIGAALARYWVGDLNGVLTLTPLLLAWRSVPGLVRQIRSRGNLILGQLAFLCATLWLVFGSGVAGEVQFVYALFAPVAWITLTWGVPGATLATLLIQIGLMLASANLLVAGSIVEIQFLLVTLGLTALLLGAVSGERALALERVAAAEAEQRALLATAPDAVLATDTDLRVVSANPAARRLFELGRESAPGTGLRQLLPALDLHSGNGRSRTVGARGTADSFPAEVAWARLDPPAREGFLLIVRDVTERERAQAQLRERDTALARAMRFALAGELATALAHELNQPMTALVSYLRAVEILVAPFGAHDPRVLETLRKSTREALRVSDVLKRLRDFYRAGGAHPAPLDLEALVAEVAEAFADRAARLGASIDVSVAPAAVVTADRIQLQMVLHNLLGNALDAMVAGATTDRRVSIRGVESAGRLALYVEDTGAGVAAEIAGQLFDAFVTTKPDGMGLGLAISRSLMRSQGGDLRLISTGPNGTRFAIDLPPTAALQVKT